MCLSKSNWTISRAAALGIYLVLLGCGPKLPVANDTEKQEAREALVAALDAWQQGKLANLNALTPSLSFRDDDVVAGNSLVSYEFDPAVEIKPHTDVQVNLILRDAQGKTQHRTATYQVSLKPSRVVIRNDQ